MTASISDEIERAHYRFVPSDTLAEMRDAAMLRHDAIMLGQNVTTPAERHEAEEWNRVRFMAAAELKRRRRA